MDARLVAAPFRVDLLDAEVLVGREPRPSLLHGDRDGGGHGVAKSCLRQRGEEAGRRVKVGAKGPTATRWKGWAPQRAV